MYGDLSENVAYVDLAIPRRNEHPEQYSRPGPGYGRGLEQSGLYQGPSISGSPLSQIHGSPIQGQYPRTRLNDICIYATLDHRKNAYSTTTDFIDNRSSSKTPLLRKPNESAV